MKSLFFPFLILLTVLCPVHSQSYDSFQQPAQDLIFFEIRDATLKSHNQEHFFESGCETFQQGKRFEAEPNLHQGQCSNHYQNVLRMHAEQLKPNSSPKSKFSFSFVKKHISNTKLQNSCPGEKAVIMAVKSYWRHGGYVPIGDVKKEVRKANFDKNYTPDFMESLRIANYFFFGQEVPESQKFQVKHEILGICVVCNDENEKKSYQHFLVDRNANAELPDIWNTKIRMLYIGEGDSCDESDKTWAEKKSNLHLRAESYDLQNRGYEIGWVLKDIKNYFRNFPKYNALYNCQHFANNLYNKITGKKEDFISKDVMILKERGGKTNEMKLAFNFE